MAEFMFWFPLAIELTSVKDVVVKVSKKKPPNPFKFNINFIPGEESSLVISPTLLVKINNPLHTNVVAISILSVP